MNDPHNSAGKQGLPLRAMVWVDGQNLFHGVKKLFDRREPDFDVSALAQSVCERRGLHCTKVLFYTGMPTYEEQPQWAGYWDRKLERMSRPNQDLPVEVYAPPLRYRSEWQQGPGDHMRLYRKPVEKGVDVRMALDMVDAVYSRSCEAMIIFSQDNDLREAVERCRQIANGQGRKILIASAFPDGGMHFQAQRGIRDTEWLPFDRQTYESCLDPVHGWGQHANAAHANRSDQRGSDELALHRGQKAMLVVDSAERHSDPHQQRRYGA